MEEPLEYTQMLNYQEIHCPYCGESQTVTLDCSAEVQDYFEDCRVCCRPISFHVICTNHGDLESLDIKTENDV